MLNNIHDSFFKSLFSVKEDLLDLLRGTLPESILSRVHLATLEYDPTEYVDQELAPYLRDICCNMRYGDQEIKVTLLYEHKSYPEKYIHLQLLGYILNIWESQADNKQELTPVICMVFYHGKSRWPHAHFLLNAPIELKRYLPIFEYILFDTKEMEDHSIIRHFQSPSVKIGVWFLKQRENLIDFIQNNPSLAREIFKEISRVDQSKIERFVVYLYNVSGVVPEKIDQIMKTVSPEAKDAFEEFRIKLIEQGIEQGIQRGVLETATRMITRGYSDEQISEITDLSIRRIQALRNNG